MTTNHTKTILYYVQEWYKGKWVKTSGKYDDLEDARLSLLYIVKHYPGVKLRTVEETVVTTTEIKVIL